LGIYLVIAAQKFIFAISIIICIFATDKLKTATIMPSEGISKYKPNELLAYRDSLKDYRDYYNTIDFAEIKGRKEGREEGQLAIIRRMRLKGLDSATIADFTGLSPEEIEKILQ
jgi:predicted transposase/invertase (TIGR01784 family)